MTYLALLIPPIVGAIIGYSTNCLAIRMLFRPFRPVYFFGIQLPFTPGLIPKEQARLAEKLAKTVGGRLITPEMLAHELVSSRFLKTGAEEIKTAIRNNLPRGAQYIRQFEHPKLDEKGPEMVKKLIQDHVGRFAGMFLDADKIYESMKEGILDFLSQEENLEMIADKIDEGIDHFLDEEKPPEARATALSLAFEKAAAHVTQHMDIEGIIRNRVNAFEPEEAEALILSVIRKELHIVMALGGILGFIIGWIPVVTRFMP